MEEPPDADPTFRFRFQLNYDPQVESALYDIENLKDLRLDIEHHTLQRKSLQQICCLSCGANLELPIEKSAIEEHFKHHEVTAKQSIAFDAYHKAFLGQSSHDQMQQVFYVPYNVLCAKCLLCDKSVRYNLLMAHSKEKRHSKRVQNEGHNWNYVHVRKTENDPNIGNGLVEDLNALNLSNKPDVSCKQGGKVAEKKDRKGKNGRKQETFERMDVEGDANKATRRKRRSKVGNEIKSTTYYRTDVERNDDDDDESAPSACYDEETLLQLYPTWNTPRGQRRPDILTVQKRAEFEKFCLACLRSIYARGVEHISGEKHALAVAQRRDALRRYHAFWMARPAAAQLRQVHFDPRDDKRMTCAHCRQPTPFEHCAQHDACVRVALERSAARVFAQPALCQFELRYDTEIARRFFYGAHYDLSRDVLGTHVPLAYVHGRHFYCLLCYNWKVGRMVRNVDQWKAHLLRYHCIAGAARDAHLRRVVEFHAYWTAQTSERQYYLCHFTLKIESAGVGCDQGHFLPLARAVEHVESDGCALKRRVAEEREHRVSVQRSQDEDAAADEQDAAGQEEEQRPPHRIERLRPADGGDDALPIHLQHHAQHFERAAPASVRCAPCELEMRATTAILRHHVAGAAHAAKSPPPPPAATDARAYYFCDVCNRQPAGEALWLNHLDSREHEQALKKVPATRRDDMCEHFCYNCRLVIYGDKITLIRHEVSGGRRAKKQPPNAMTDRMKELLQSRAVIEREARNLAAKCARFQRESEAKVAQCIDDLERLIKRSYPSCRIHQFGSRVAGFVVKDSDLDLFVDVGGKYMGGEEVDYHAERKVVLEVRRLLRAEPKTYVDLETVLSARVPIAKVVHAPTALDCDLSFVNGLSVENTRLIRFYADLQPTFAGAMLLLKEWGARMSHRLRNDMKSYALCMMLVFSMQRDGQLPSVDALRRRSTFAVPRIAGWDTVDYATLDARLLRADLLPAASVADVVRSFFAYYASGLRYAREVVCPLLGRTFDVKAFDALGADTPPEMHTYRRKVAADPDAQFKVGSHMFVQDPFDLGHNLTKAANRNFVTNFRHLCRLSAAHIRE